MKAKAMVESVKIQNYMHFVETPFKMVACWDWFPNPGNESRVIMNYVYLCLVLFVITKNTIVLAVHLYTEWKDIMSSLDQIADSLPLIVSLAIVSYYAIYRHDLYKMMNFMNENFKYHSARGLTNMTMQQSYKTAKRFARIYTACTMFSVTMYAVLPFILHKDPLQNWIYMDVTRSPFIQLTFLHTLLSQLFVGLAMGQFGVFFAANSVLICGQLDLLCCSLRNVRYTALLKQGVLHSALEAAHADILLDERHSYLYNNAEMTDSNYHYDKKTINNFRTAVLKYDIYDPTFDEATISALRECAQLCQVIARYKQQFEDFVSPLLVLRVVQKFDMVTVEYLAAVALDIFVYCYYGNQIILQADRVSTAAYQSSWHTMGVRARRLLVNILLANLRAVVVRAGRFLPMDLHTFLLIIKTSFSYYTLLVNVNEK